MGLYPIRQRARYKEVVVYVYFEDIVRNYLLDKVKWKVSSSIWCDKPAHIQIIISCTPDKEIHDFYPRINILILPRLSYKGKIKEAHGPLLAYFSETATADMQHFSNPVIANDDHHLSSSWFRRRRMRFLFLLCPRIGWCWGHIVFWFSVHRYVRMNVHPSVRMCVHKYIHDPVRLRLRHLYQVEFCSFIVRYPTAGASVYCGHICSFFYHIWAWQSMECHHLNRLSISFQQKDQHEIWWKLAESFQKSCSTI